MTEATMRDYHDDTRDPLAPVKRMGVRTCWVTDLGAPAIYIADYRVMLLESRLSRAEVYAYVRRWLRAHFPENP